MGCRGEERIWLAFLEVEFRGECGHRNRHFLGKSYGLGHSFLVQCWE